MRLLPDFHSSGLNDEEIISMMVADGISYQEIAKYVPWDRHRIGQYVTANLANNGYPQGTGLKIDPSSNKAICHICRKHVELKNMPTRNLNIRKLYILSYCKECELVNPEENPLMEGSLAKKLATKEKAFRLRYDATTLKIPYGYFSFLYLKQEGLCFYTDIPLSFKKQEDIVTTISLDRVIFNNQYEQGNIVFTINKVNIIKSDMTLDEMLKWTPKWHSRAVNFLKNQKDYMLEVAK